MDGPPTAAEPAVRAATAVRDLHDAVNAVSERTDCDVHLVGTSWGTMVTGRLLAADDSPEIASATPHAPVYRPTAELVEGFDLGDPPRAYRTVSRAEARNRWDRQFLDDEPAAYRGGSEASDPVFDAFWQTLVTTLEMFDESVTYYQPEPNLGAETKSRVPRPSSEP